MDPDRNIKEQLKIAEEIIEIQDAADPATGRYTVAQLDDLADKAMRLAELVEALNMWLMRGGMYPALWGTRCVNVDAHVKARP